MNGRRFLGWGSPCGSGCRARPGPPREISPRASVVADPEDQQADAEEEEGPLQPVRDLMGNRRRADVMIEIDDRPAEQHQDHRQRQEHQQVDRDVPEPDGDHRPGVGRQEAEAGEEVAAELPQVVNRAGLLVHDLRPHQTGPISVGRQEDPVRLGLLDAVGVELPLDVADVPIALQPGGQPSPGVAAAGDGREIVEPSQQPQLCQPLEEPDGVRPAPDPAAGERHAHQMLIQRLTPGLGQPSIHVDRREPVLGLFVL